MVTIIPGYVYSIFAALIVGAIIVGSCSVSMVNVRNEAENQQLANVDEYVASAKPNLGCACDPRWAECLGVSESSFTNREPRIFNKHSERLVQRMG